ncbi:MAG: hypothetical protein ACREEM_43580 [Blastocatellia bacterium]
MVKSWERSASSPAGIEQQSQSVFFTDSFLEVNGVAHTSRQLAAFTERRDIPFLVVHAAPETKKTEEGRLSSLALKRSRAGFELDADPRFDLLMWRYARLAVGTVRGFGADAVHVTGPSDIGQLGVYVASRLKLPLVISWRPEVHHSERTERPDRRWRPRIRRGRSGAARVARTAGPDAPGRAPIGLRSFVGRRL